MERENAELRQRAAQRMRRLITSLLELARLDAGQEAPARHPCDLAESLRTASSQSGPLPHSVASPFINN